MKDLATVPSRSSDRVASLAVALVAGGVLLVAAWLEPAAAGHGTHTALGLPPCTFLAWTGQPCPMCGATTAFTLMAHGMPVAALLTQPFATALFVLDLGVLGVAGAEVVAPADRWRRVSRWVEPFEDRLALGILATMIAAWIYKIASMA